LVDDEPSRGREIALTFDDGPWYPDAAVPGSAGALLGHGDVLEIGRQLGEYGENGAVERRMLADGDMIGDHNLESCGTSPGRACSPGIRSRMPPTRSAPGHARLPPLPVPCPFGDLSPALISEARSLGYTTIQWSIDPRDWALPALPRSNST